MSSLTRLAARIALTFLVLATALAGWIENRRQRAEDWARSAVQSIQDDDLQAADLAVRNAVALSPSACYLGLQGLIGGRRGMDEFSGSVRAEPDPERQGHLRNALAAFNSALAANPDDDVFWHNRGWVRLSLGEAPAAVIGDFERAIRIDGATPMYRVSAGLIYERLDRPVRAIDQYAAAVMSEPNIVESRFSVEIRTRRPELWRAAIDRAISQLQSGRDMPVRARLARLHLAREPLDRALPELQALTMEFPQLPRAWTNLGRAYVLNGRLDQAGECFNKALALDARDGYTVLQVALLSWERGNVKGAEALFRRAARGLGRRPSPHATRARRVYETGAVVSDDILPPGLLESCQVSAKDYQAGAMGTPGLPRNR